MSANKPKLRMNRSRDKDLGKNELAIIQKGLDEQLELYDPMANDVKGTSILLNSYYRTKIQRIAEAMTLDMGVKINKTSLLAKAAKEYIDDQYSLLDLPDLPTPDHAKDNPTSTQPLLHIRLADADYYEFQKLAAIENLSPKQFLLHLMEHYQESKKNVDTE